MLESTVTPIAGRAARVGCQSPDPFAALFLRSLRGAPSPFSTPPSPRYNRHRMDIYEELVRLRNLGQKCALATIVEVRGSIPSYESAKLLVREDGSMTGTIGGGCVEAEVWNAAREVIQTEKTKHLSQVATLAGFASVVIDNRDTFANRERFPEAAEVHAAEYEEVFPKLAINETSYIVIVTRGHRDDMRVLQLAIATPARYIAMIGSKRKVLNVIRELEKAGIARTVFE